MEEERRKSRLPPVKIHLLGAEQIYQGCFADPSFLRAFEAQLCNFARRKVGSRCHRFGSEQPPAAIGEN
jgi:hypothetical protein